MYLIHIINQCYIWAKSLYPLNLKILSLQIFTNLLKKNEFCWKAIFILQYLYIPAPAPALVFIVFNYEQKRFLHRVL